MQHSLIGLAISLAALRAAQDTLPRRARGGTPAPAGDGAIRWFAAWRYYGFSSRPAEADKADAKPVEDEVVASPPAVGSVVSILPDDCLTTVVNGRVYRQCGSVWYQRQYTGTKVTYVVVPAP